MLFASLRIGTNYTGVDLSPLHISLCSKATLGGNVFIRLGGLVLVVGSPLDLMESAKAAENVSQVTIRDGSNGVGVGGDLVREVKLDHIPEGDVLLVSQVPLLILSNNLLTGRCSSKRYQKSDQWGMSLGPGRARRGGPAALRSYLTIIRSVSCGHVSMNATQALASDQINKMLIVTRWHVWP